LLTGSSIGLVLGNLTTSSIALGLGNRTASSFGRTGICANNMALPLSGSAPEICESPMLAASKVSASTANE
jgi:hypothetical protein